MSYRRQLLQAVEAFLEGTPSSRVRAQRIIQRCFATIRNEAKEATLDQIIWGSFIRALTDSVYYERRTRSCLDIHHRIPPERFSVRTFDPPSLPMEWHAQQLSMVDFLGAIPYAKIHVATFPAWQRRDTWTTMCTVIPEAVQADVAEADYQRRKALIEAIAARSPLPEQMVRRKSTMWSCERSRP